MDEARRFLRYLMPGVVFGTETALLLLIVLPGPCLRLIGAVPKENGLFLAVASILASGGVGFILSVIYHRLLWGLDLALDYRPLMSRLVSAGILTLQVFGPTEIEELPPDRKLNRQEAWVLLTAIWHVYLESSPRIRAAEPKILNL